MSDPRTPSTPTTGDETTQETFERLEREAREARKERRESSDDPRYAAMDRIASLASTSIKDVLLAELAADRARFRPSKMDEMMRTAMESMARADEGVDPTMRAAMNKMTEEINSSYRGTRDLREFIGPQISKSAMAAAALDERLGSSAIEKAIAEAARGSFKGYGPGETPVLSSRAPSSFSGMGSRPQRGDTYNITVNVAGGTSLDDVQWHLWNRSKN